MIKTEKQKEDKFFKFETNRNKAQSKKINDFYDIDEIDWKNSVNMSATELAEYYEYNS